MVYFKSKLWIIGGLDNLGEPTNKVYSSDDDGYTWTESISLVTRFPAKYGHKCLVFDSKVYMFGGLTGVNTMEGSIWVSFDGKDWYVFKSEIPQNQRYYYSAIVYQRYLETTPRMLLASGMNGFPGNLNYVQYLSDSEDGNTFIDYDPFGITLNQKCPILYTDPFENKTYLIGQDNSNPSQVYQITILDPSKPSNDSAQYAYSQYQPDAVYSYLTNQFPYTIDCNSFHVDINSMYPFYYYHIFSVKKNSQQILVYGNFAFLNEFDMEPLPFNIEGMVSNNDVIYIYGTKSGKSYYATYDVAESRCSVRNENSIWCNTCVTQTPALYLINKRCIMCSEINESHFNSYRFESVTYREVVSSNVVTEQLVKLLVPDEYTDCIPYTAFTLSDGYTLDSNFETDLNIDTDATDATKVNLSPTNIGYIWTKTITVTLTLNSLTKEWPLQIGYDVNNTLVYAYIDYDNLGLEMALSYYVYDDSLTIPSNVNSRIRILPVYTVFNRAKWCMQIKESTLSLYVQQDNAEDCLVTNQTVCCHKLPVNSVANNENELLQSFQVMIGSGTDYSIYIYYKYGVESSNYLVGSEGYPSAVTSVQVISACLILLVLIYVGIVGFIYYFKILEHESTD